LLSPDQLVYIIQVDRIFLKLISRDNIRYTSLILLIGIISQGKSIYRDSGVAKGTNHVSTHQLSGQTSGYFCITQHRPI